MSELKFEEKLAKQHADTCADRDDESWMIAYVAFKKGFNKAKSELRKEFEDWFCNGYCRFYGDEDYCSTCPLKKEECWLKD